MVTDWTPGPWKVGGPTGFVNQISIQPAIGIVYGAGQEIAANAASSPPRRSWWKLCKTCATRSASAG